MMLRLHAAMESAGDITPSTRFRKLHQPKHCTARGVGALAGLVLCGLIAFFGPARSDEGGVSFWLPGQFASLAAPPPPPGFYLESNSYGWSGSAEGNQSFDIGLNVVARVQGSLYGELLSAVYVPETPILGGRLSLGLTGIYANANVTGDISAGRVSVSRTDNLHAFGDLYPIASLHWNDGLNNWMVYATGDIPVGAYSPTRLANVGIGHGAFDGGGAYTYLDPTSGHEFSVTAGFTGNFENGDTNYQNGVDFHLDWAASQFLSKQIYAGVAGYWYQQVSADSGAGARLGSFESRVASVGPQFGYLFSLGGQQASLNARVYWEFDAARRLGGTDGFLTLGIPLWGPPPASATPAAASAAPTSG
jgi:hypothetical protein